jgi:hypothetical protein
MAGAGGGCAFCGATADIVPTGVLDEKWSRRFGGEPVVALDHGWYTTVRGERRAADHLDPAKFFGPHVRALCDYCVHGWVEDVRWRAEPTLLALAQGQAQSALPGESPALARWAQLTAMLAELVEGMPRAASPAQRDAVRRGSAPAPAVDTWVFAMRQRLPARVHLSQVSCAGGSQDDTALVQIVSVDLAHLSALVVLPSSPVARTVDDGAALADALTTPGAGPPAPVLPLDLSVSRHPHQVAVQRVCAASTGPAAVHQG